MLAKPNQVVITHLGEPCVYEIDRCELSVTSDGLDFDVYTKKNKECPLGHLSAPELHIEYGTVTATTRAELTNEELNVEVGWDTDEESKEDNIFRIYISQHQALNKNQVRIIRNQANQIEILWTSEAQDFNYFKNPNCSVHVHCVIDDESSRAIG